MFIRFVSGDTDEDSHVATGLFGAAAELRWSETLPEYEFDALIELRDWFNANLESPFDYLSRTRRHERAVCWFRSTAYEHLARAWDLVTILERNDVLIWTIKSQRTGFVYYEDEAQVFAEPFADIRRMLRR